MKPSFEDSILVHFDDLEIHHISSPHKLNLFIIRKIKHAIREETIRPWLEVKGSDKE